LLRPDFLPGLQAGAGRLASRIDGIALIVGYPEEHEGRRYNAAAVIENGEQRRFTARFACRITKFLTKSAISMPAAKPVS
jgi:predicted amidohydrolase